MWSSLADNFTQPIAVYATKGPTKGSCLAQLVLEIIKKLENCGAEVHGTVCDGASTNRKMWMEFGISGKLSNTTNKVIHPVDDSRDLYFFSDTPHLIKCIRNRFLNNNALITPEGGILWEYYKILLQLDQTQSNNTRVCPKITEMHINPNGFMKMRVKLATQIFSNSVAEGLIHYQRRCDRLKNADCTISFTRRINNLFDVLNSRRSGEGIISGSKDFEVLRENLNFINHWENMVVEKKITKDHFLSSSTAEGLRVTISSTMDLCNYLLKTRTFSYVLTSKMNQDPLERFFGTIRQAGCDNDHPTMVTFMHVYRLLSTYKLLKPPKFGNCTNDEDESQNTVLSITNFKAIFCDNDSANKAQHIEKIKGRKFYKFDRELISINTFFENDNKIIKRGVNAFGSNHVNSMEFDADLMIIREDIYANSLDLRKTVKSYLDRKGVRIERFADNLPGSEWVRCYLQRHPDLSQRFAANIKSVRAAVTSTAINSYFDNLAKELDGVPPSNIWNYDESNLVDNPGCKKIITKRGSKYPERIINSSKQSTSVMYCGNAAGEILPPYIVYRATNLYDSWTQGGPQGARYNRSKSGWFEGAIFEDWFEFLLLPRLKKLEGVKVAIGDNLSSHLSRQILTDYKLNGTNKTISKQDFPRLLRLLTDSLAKTGQGNLASGFAKAGIFPLNRTKVLERIPGNENYDPNIQANVSASVINITQERRFTQESIKTNKKKVNITLNKSGEITDGNCTSSRGIKCHHLAALALFGHYNISVTDKLCTWNMPKSKNVEVKTAKDMYVSCKTVLCNRSEDKCTGRISPKTCLTW
ncbi:hypothetical protein PPYR_00033 [Photinus pyralis]|uniref:Uncharacterized protein n=1 Tax=Photinus pyralis TaxID=7054 RepID=A0A5N4B0I6_PHOPY|nr:hypothetical protein PPYR_00033 [Photinus pyralis]